MNGAMDRRCPAKDDPEILHSLSSGRGQPRQAWQAISPVSRPLRYNKSFLLALRPKQLDSDCDICESLDAIGLEQDKRAFIPLVAVPQEST